MRLRLAPVRPPVIAASLGLLAALAFLLPGCPKPKGPRPKVVTTIFPVYDLTRRIAGPDADVIVLEPAGASPHSYSPTPGDVERATGASLAVMVGLNLDAWMTPLMARVAPKARVLRVADRVPTLAKVARLPEEGQPPPRTRDTTQQDPNDPAVLDAVDPHVWLDPQRALLMARAISDELCRVDPGNATAYRGRALTVTHSLEALDQELEKRIAAWTPARSFVTLHDSFRYFAGRYHLEVAAAIEVEPGVRPAIRYDQLVLRRMRERSSAAVFGEPQLDSQPARTIAQAAQLPYAVLDPIGGGPGAESYEALLRGDADVIEKTLFAARPAGSGPATGASPPKDQPGSPLLAPPAPANLPPHG